MYLEKLEAVINEVSKQKHVDTKTKLIGEPEKSLVVSRPIVGLDLSSWIRTLARVAFAPGTLGGFVITGKRSEAKISKNGKQIGFLVVERLDDYRAGVTLRKGAE